MTRNFSKLAIAILHYRMPELLASMRRQLAGGPHDVFVFDNGGQAARRLSWATVVSWPQNKMFVGGWNMAMSLLHEYDYVWMLNDDVEGVSQEMATGLMRIFPFCPWHTAAITPAFNSPHAAFRPKIFPTGKDGIYPPREARWVDWCCPVVFMEAWRQVGPFDECFVGYGADLDWCRRAREQRWRFFVADRWRVHHIGSVTALHHGLQHKQGDVGRMNELLKEKWGVSDWTQMT